MSRRHLGLILAVLAAAAPAGAGPGALAPQIPPALPAGVVPIVYPASGFAEVLNQFRRTAGLGAVSANRRLARAAQDHAEWLRARGTLSHTGRNGSTIGQRARAAGCDWGSVAENLAEGYSTSAQVVQAWAASPDHRANMLGRQFRVFGLGRAGDVWVLMLADRC